MFAVVETRTRNYKTGKTVKTFDRFIDAENYRRFSQPFVIGTLVVVNKGQGANR